MARRSRTSPVEGVVGVVALLPWWAGVALALVLWLDSVATSPLPPVTPGKAGGLATRTMWQGLATGLQYLLPFLCLFGAVASAIARHQRKALVEEAAQNPSAEVLDGMSWRDFELLVGEAFRQRGYSVAETGGGGADGGIDLILAKGSERFLVQCKQRRAHRVPVNVGQTRQLGARSGLIWSLAPAMGSIPLLTRSAFAKST